MKNVWLRPCFYGIKRVSVVRVHQGKLLLHCKSYDVGGESASGELLPHCESYEPLTDDWHREEKLLGPRKDHACLAARDTLYLTGGVSKTEPYSDHIWYMSMTLFVNFDFGFYACVLAV